MDLLIFPHHCHDHKNRKDFHDQAHLRLQRRSYSTRKEDGKEECRRPIECIGERTLTKSPGSKKAQDNKHSNNETCTQIDHVVNRAKSQHWISYNNSQRGDKTKRRKT